MPTTWTEIPDDAVFALPRPAIPLRVFAFADLHGDLGQPEGTRLEALDAARRTREEAGEEVLVLDAGDDLAGGVADALAFDPEHPDPIACLSLAVGVAARVPGNHDLDPGASLLVRRVTRGESPPLVAANLPAASPLAEVARPTRRFRSTRGWVVGVMGLMTPSQTDPALGIGCPLEAVHRHLPSLARRCHAVVILSHLGMSAADEAASPPRGDAALLERIPFLAGATPTWIIGAHTHRVVVRGAGAGLVPYVQPGQRGERLAIGLLGPGADAFAVEAGPWPAHDPEGVSPTTLAASTRIRDALERARRDWTPIVVPSGIPPGDHPLREVHRGESPTMNLVTDLLAEGVAPSWRCAEGRVPLVALCHRMLGPGRLEGVLDLDAWHRCFPYGDSAALLEIPRHRLPALLLASARRLDGGDGYRPDRGLLHFDRRLRQGVKRDGEGNWTLASLEIEGKPWVGDERGTIALLTTTYVALGADGWDEALREAGIPPEDRRVRVLPTTLREPLAPLLRLASAVGRPTGPDGRLAVWL